MAICRVYERPDGSVAVVHPAPDHDPEDAFTQTVERDPSLAGLPYVDLTTDDLPGRHADCADCGEAHSVRNLWSVRAGAIVVDDTLPNPHAEHRHLEQQIAAELDKPDADHLTVLKLQHAQRKAVEAIGKPRAAQAGQKRSTRRTLSSGS